MSKYPKVNINRQCFVPSCTNNSARTPSKEFFNIPKDNVSRWCTAVGYNGIVKQGLKICEDHLNLENDLENYSWLRTMGGHAKLKSKPPVLRNIHRVIGTKACQLCKKDISGCQYVCIECNIHMCGSCEPESHLDHYLLRIPADRNEDEAKKYLLAIQHLFCNEEFLPTKYVSLSVNENMPSHNEEDITEIEFIEDNETSKIDSININDNVDDGEVIGDNDDNKQSPDGFLLLEYRREKGDNKKITRLKDDDEEERSAEGTYSIIPEQSTKQITEQDIFSKRRKRSRTLNEIWTQHQGKQSRLDVEASEILTGIVLDKKYQDMFKNGVTKKVIWHKIASEMMELGYEFGTRDAKRVCAQKWWNLQMKAKRSSD